MLQIVPKNWWAQDWRVLDEAGPVAGISMSWWRNRALMTADGETWRAGREAPLSGAFLLEGARGVLARAEKASVFRRALTIRHDGASYSLRPRSMFRQAFVLLEGSREVGSVAPKNAFTRKAVADLPDDLPLPVRLFIAWLAMTSWRDNDAA